MFRKSSPVAKPETPASTGTTASVTEAAPCEKSLRLHLGRETIAPVRAMVLAEFQKQATLQGFRKGKAPAELIERQYAKAIQDETLHRVTKQALEQAAKEHHLKPVGPFEIRKADFSETDGLSLEATVEVEPSFALATCKGIPLTREPLDVTAADMEQALASLQESMAQLVPVKPEGAAESEPKAEAEVKKERQVPALDDELAKDLGYETLEKLKTHVEAKLREQKRAHQADALEAALCDALLARHTFEVPSRLVQHQAERLTRDFKARLLLSGVPEATVSEEAAKFIEQLRTSAARHVKLSFILERIAAQESVTVSQDELVGRLWQLSQRWKKDPVEVRKMFDAQGLWASAVSSIRQEETIAWLLAAASITDRHAGAGGGTA